MKKMERVILVVMYLLSNPYRTIIDAVFDILSKALGKSSSLIFRGFICISLHHANMPLPVRQQHLKRYWSSSFQQCLADMVKVLSAGVCHSDIHL
jgi:hypothetical protein